MHLAGPKMLRLTERASQDLWRDSILNQNTRHLTHSTRDLSSNSHLRASVGAEKQGVGVGHQCAARARQQLQRQICITGRGKSNRNLALPCAERGWPPLSGQEGALPDDFGALLPDDLGGLLLLDLGAGHAGDLGWAPLLARLKRPTSPDAVRPEVLRTTPGRKLEMTSAHCSAVGRRSGSLMHLATRSATSCGASSGTLRAPTRPASAIQCHRRAGCTLCKGCRGPSTASTGTRCAASARTLCPLSALSRRCASPARVLKRRRCSWNVS